MGNFLNLVGRTISSFSFLDAIDILMVTFGIYFLLRLVRGTRAIQLIKGFIAVAVIVLITGTDPFRLHATHWILSIILQSSGIALIILFQPELRLVVEQIGRGRFLREAFRPGHNEEVVAMINDVVRAARRLSEQKIGALIAIEREVGLNDIIATGRRITGNVSSDLLQTIFYPGTPMHDGGIVIQGTQLAAAMCLFPLTDQEYHPRSMGTRHRAALGLSELTDAVIVVVSEETGTISIALHGQLITNLSVEALKERLLALLQTTGAENNRWFWRRDNSKSTPSAAKNQTSHEEGPQ